MATIVPSAVSSRRRLSLVLSDRVALVIIVVATLLFRLAFLWPEQIDWDEWSFILMGNDVAQGHLPFVHLFDLKPPLLFFLEGATIVVFGKSLLAIRLLGLACVALAASMVYLSGRRVAGPWPALAGALITAALASASFGLATNTELPSIALLATAMRRLTRTPLRDRDAAIAGVLVSLAVLTRTNLALVALCVGLLLVAAALARQSAISRRAWLAFGVAGLLPVVLLMLPYAAASALPTLKLALVDMPLAYSANQDGMVAVGLSHITQFYYTAQKEPLLFVPPFLLALVGATLALRDMVRSDTTTRWPLAVALTMTAGVVGSLLIGGIAFPHYWLQLMPFVGLFAGLAVARISALSRRAALASAGLAALSLATTLITSLMALPANLAAPHAIQQAAAHIRATGGSQPQVWAMHKHLVLWYLDAPQLSRAGVHPDGLARRVIIDALAAHGYVGRDELGRVLVSRPQFVVTDAGGKGLAWIRADGRPVDAWLAQNYRKDSQFGDVIVYRRR
jgi:4-amino-4-deoxy-L-arabinose transferase-like glycosyltransferase